MEYLNAHLLTLSTYSIPSTVYYTAQQFLSSFLLHTQFPPFHFRLHHINQRHYLPIYNGPKPSTNHLRDTYDWSQHPKYNTQNPYVTLTRRLIHLHYFLNALNISCHTTTPGPILYNFLYLIWKLRTVQHNYSLQLHTCHHAFLLARTLRFSNNHTSTPILYPHHSHPYLLFKYTFHNGISTTTSYKYGISTTTHAKQRNRRYTTSLPHAARTIIL